MSDDRVLDELISRMVDSGKSDDDIRFIVDHYKTDPTVRETIRQSNMKAQAGVNTDPSVAFRDSLGDTALRTAEGVGKGALSIIDPRTYLGAIKTYGGAAATHLFAPAPNTDLTDIAKGAAQTVKSVASGDPDVGGQAIGQLATGAILPHALPYAPDALATTGAGVDKLGTLATKATPFGLAEAAFRMDPKGLAVAAAPYGIKLLGKAMQKGGELMGGEDYFAPETPTPPVSKNAGGILLKNPPMRVPVEDQLAGALDEVRQPPADPSVSMPNARTMTVAGRPASTAEEFAISNPAVATAGQVMTSDVAAGPVEQQAAAMQAPTGNDILAKAATETDPRLPIERAAGITLSPEARAAYQPGQAKGAAAARQDKMWIRDAVPPSRSSGTAGAGSLDSATPGLTRNDMEAVGLNPDVKVTKLTKAMADKILASRAARHSSYAEQASLATRLNMLIEKD